MRNLSIWTRRMFFLLFFIATTNDWGVAENSSENEIIETIKAFNKLYNAAVFAEGTYSLSAQILDMDASFPLSELKFTQSGNHCALLQETANDSSSYRAFLFDGRKEYAKNNKILGYSSLQVQNPNSPFLLRQKFVLLAMGRGAVVQEHDITEFQENANAIPKTIFIRGKASNLMAHGRDGMWEMEVLPDAGYMLKRAKFYYEGIEEYHYMVETSGVVNSNGCFYPESATIRQRFAGDYIEHQYRFSNVRLEFDNKLYDKVKSLIDHTSEETGTFVMDDSGGKSDVYRVGANVRKEYALEPRPVWRRLFVIAGINLLGIALILYLIYRNRRRKEEQEITSSK